MRNIFVSTINRPITFVAAFCIIFFFFFRSANDPWDRIINSDGMGYYAYLPAVFIYHDLSLGFLEKVQDTHYPSDPNTRLNFTPEVNGKKVNKFLCGTAILLLPFFVAAHLFSLFFTTSADGYGLVYQYSVFFASVFYLCIGLLFLRKTLIDFYNAKKTFSGFIALAMLFGTNLFYYTILEPSFSHVYSFSLHCLFAYFVCKMIAKFSPPDFIFSSVIFSLLVLIRPTNILCLAAIPFLASDYFRLKTFFENIFKNKMLLLIGLSMFILIFSIQLIFWKIQTGNFFLYSYGDEQFNFKNPQVLNFLFSYRRGWLVYNPLVILSLFGLITLFFKNKFQLFFILIFLSLLIYVFSSWWCWWYGAYHFGQRILTDYYGYIAILLFILLSNIQINWLKTGITISILFICCLNLLRIYQHRNRIFPEDNVTKEIFWDKFFSFKRDDRTRVDNSLIENRAVWKSDMENSPNNSTIVDDIYFSKNHSSKIAKDNPYSVGIQEKIAAELVGDGIINISAQVYSDVWHPTSCLVVSVEDSSGIYFYKSFTWLPEFVLERKKWEFVTFSCPISLKKTNDLLTIYFWSPTENFNVYIDDIEAEIIKLKR